ncbi:hypothetical protein [Parasitella parasitica]|uniref:Uncharacterized protein n=1 Tax=Parasitella parasitica TaxID=35722 RepID=A0A0B7N267_9FUNG|nr:hypothetical protein [Parasitella parasitica]
MLYNKEKLVRGHRRESASFTLPELQDLRAHQRTFEGAYWRTALAAFSSGLLILKPCWLLLYGVDELRLMCLIQQFRIKQVEIGSF